MFTGVQAPIPSIGITAFASSTVAAGTVVARATRVLVAAMMPVVGSTLLGTETVAVVKSPAELRFDIRTITNAMKITAIGITTMRCCWTYVLIVAMMLNGTDLPDCGAGTEGVVRGVGRAGFGDTSGGSVCGGIDGDRTDGVVCVGRDGAGFAGTPGVAGAVRGTVGLFSAGVWGVGGAT